MPQAPSPQPHPAGPVPILLLDARRERELCLARDLSHLARRFPASPSIADLNKLIHRVQARASKTAETRLDAVLDALSNPCPPQTVREIAADTGLSRTLVKAALEELTAAQPGLLEIWTRGGKRDCGRSGTVLYYRLKQRGR